MSINHQAIISQYKTDPTAHRRLQQDAVARMEQEQRAGNFAAELRAMTRPKPLSVTVPAELAKNVTTCPRCGSGQAIRANGQVYCGLCGRNTMLLPSATTTRTTGDAPLRSGSSVHQQRSGVETAARSPRPVTRAREPTSRKLFCVKCGSTNTVTATMGKRYAQCMSCNHVWER